MYFCVLLYIYRERDSEIESEPIRRDCLVIGVKFLSLTRAYSYFQKVSSKVLRNRSDPSSV